MVKIYLSIFTAFRIPRLWAFGGKTRQGEPRKTFISWLFDYPGNAKQVFVFRSRQSPSTRPTVQTNMAHGAGLPELGSLAQDSKHVRADYL